MIGGTAYVLEKAPWLFSPSVINMLLRLVWPLIDGKKNVVPDATLPKPPEFCETLMGDTPGDSSSSCVKFRPLSGRSTTCFAATTVPSWDGDCCTRFDATPPARMLGRVAT